MKPSSELFKLIKSLSKSEKRFFKLSSALQSGEKNYLKIFDFIEKQGHYDEEELKLAFLNETFVKHLPSEKNHLYRLILKSLRVYYSEQSASSILKQELKNVEILYSKALYKECEKFVQRAKSLAQENEEFYYWYELISWEKRLLEAAYEDGEFSQDLDVIVAEEETVIEKLRNVAEYQVIYSKINLIFRSGGFTRNEAERKVVDDISDYHLIKGKNTALSTRASSMCYYIKGLCAATVRNYEDSFQFFNRTKTILDNNPLIKQDLAQRYVLTLSFLIRCHVDNKQFKEAQDLIQEMRSLEKQKGFNSTDISLRILTISFNAEFFLYHAMGDFAKSKRIAEEIDFMGGDLIDKIPKEQAVLFLYNKAYSYFGNGDYKKALQILNEVLNDNEQRLRQDIYSFARIFNLIIHYELENFDFLEYIVKSTNRYLNKYERDYEIEQCVLKHIRKLAKIISPAQRIEIFEKLKEEVETLMKDPQERVILEYFHLPAWIDSQLKKIDFPTAVQQYDKHLN
jgi:tetratricopeptide (TPR) repeat protein